MSPDVPTFLDHDVECPQCHHMYAPERLYMNPCDAWFICPVCGCEDSDPLWNPPLTAWDYVLAEYPDEVMRVPYREPHNGPTFWSVVLEPTF